MTGVSNYRSIEFLFNSLFRVTAKGHVAVLLWGESHWWPVVYPHKGTASWKMFPIDDVIKMKRDKCLHRSSWQWLEGITTTMAWWCLRPEIQIMFYNQKGKINVKEEWSHIFDVLRQLNIVCHSGVFGAFDGECAFTDASLRWRHYGHDGVSNHQPHDCLRNRLFRRRSKTISKLRVTGLCAGKSPGTGKFPAQTQVTRKMFPFDDVSMLVINGV